MHTYNTQAYIKNRHLGHVLITWFKNKKQTKEKQEWLASPKTQNKLNNTGTACDDTSKYQHSSTPRATSHTQGTESKIHELLSLFSKKITTRLNERAVCLYIPGLCSNYFATLTQSVGLMPFQNVFVSKASLTMT